MATGGSPIGNPFGRPNEKAPDGTERVKNELERLQKLNTPPNQAGGQDLHFGINQLNSIDPPLMRRTLDDTSILGAMREAGLQTFSYDVLRGTGPYIGILLRVDKPATGENSPATGPFGVLNYIAQGSNQPPTFRVNIPELHSMLPEPHSWEDHVLIDMYPKFHMQSTKVAEEGLPVPGDLVLVDFQDKNNFTRGVFLGSYNAGGSYGEVTTSLMGDVAGLGRGQSAAFDQVCLELPTEAPKGDALLLRNIHVPSQEVGHAPFPREKNLNTGLMRDVSPPYEIGPITETFAAAHPRTSKLWFDALRAHGVRGQSWIGKYRHNGFSDSIERESPGRETIIFTPRAIQTSSPVEMIYYFHDVGGFDQKEFSKRVVPAIKKIDSENRNFVFVYHELMWSKGDTGKFAQRTENTPRTAGIFKNTDTGGDFSNLHLDVIKTVDNVFNVHVDDIAFISFVAVGRGGRALKNIAEENILNNINPGVGSVTMASADFAIKSNYENKSDEGDSQHKHSWTWKIWNTLKDTVCEFNILCVGTEEAAPAELYSDNRLPNPDHYSWKATRTVPDEIPFIIDSATGKTTPQTREQIIYDEVVDRFRPTANSLRFIHDYYYQRPKINSSLIIPNPPPNSEADGLSHMVKSNQAITVTYHGTKATHEQICDFALLWKNELHINKHRFAKPRHYSTSAAAAKDVFPQGPGKLGFKDFGAEEKLISDEEYAAHAKWQRRRLDKYPRSATGVVQLSSLCGSSAEGTKKAGQGDFGLPSPRSRTVKANKRLVSNSSHVTRWKNLNFAAAAIAIANPKWDKSSGDPKPMTYKEISSPGGYGKLKKKFASRKFNKLGWGGGRRSYWARSDRVYPYWYTKGIGGLPPRTRVKDLFGPQDMSTAEGQNNPLFGPRLEPSYAAQFLKAMHYAVTDQMGRIYYLGARGWDDKGQQGGIECVGYTHSVRVLTFMLIWGEQGGPITGINAEYWGQEIADSAKAGNNFWRWFDNLLAYRIFRNKIYNPGVHHARSKGWFPIAPVGSGPKWAFPGTDAHGARNTNAPEYYLGTPNNIEDFPGGMGTNMWSGRNLMPGDIIKVFFQPFSPECTDERAEKEINEVGKSVPTKNAKSLPGGPCTGARKIGKNGHKGFNRPHYAQKRREPAFQHNLIVFANEETGGDLWVAESGYTYRGSGAMPLELYRSYSVSSYLQVWQPPEMYDVWKSVKHLTGTPSGRPQGEWSRALYKELIKSVAIPSPESMTTLGADGQPLPEDSDIYFPPFDYALQPKACRKSTCPPGKLR